MEERVCLRPEVHGSHDWSYAIDSVAFRCPGRTVRSMLPESSGSVVERAILAGNVAADAHQAATANTPKGRAKRVLDELAVEATAENIAQMCAYLEAFEIFLDRNKRHRAGWRVAGVTGILVDIRKKCERLWNEFVLGDEYPDDIDSALDLMNYTAFFIQAHHEEKETGKPVGDWRWKKEDR